MSIRLPTYGSRKAAPVAWLGEMPSHWNIAPGFAVFTEKHTKNRGLVEKTVLSLSYGRIVIKPSDRLHGLVPESFETYQIIEPDDIIIRPTDLQNDWNSLRVGIAHDRGIITSAYMCLKTREPMLPEYGYLLLHTYDLKKIFYGLGSGLRQNLDFNDLKRLPMMVPPLEEQVHIVTFLTKIGRKINRLIQSKQRLITLLEEQKQAIIHHTVTRGLNPGVRLNPSGLHWLEDVPEHWMIAQLRRRFEIVDCKHLTVPFIDVGVPLASVREVQRFEVTLDNAKRTTEEWYQQLIEGGRQPQPGDLIYCRNVSVGACALVTTSAPLAMGQDVCLIRSATENGRFLNYFMRSSAMKRQLAQILIGSTFSRINISEIKSLLAVFPPLEEQLAIAEYLDDALRSTEYTITSAQRQVSLLREYRTRLVADVVTGQLDVRGVALPPLPDLGAEDPDTDLDDAESADLLEAAEALDEE
jgi:type I restriction enzyme S subunit